METGVSKNHIERSLLLLDHRRELALGFLRSVRQFREAGVFLFRVRL
jgi:hypothetical protein